jgi:SAM-dependent methyltransferase
MNIRRDCPICNGDQISVFLTRASVPIRQNTVFDGQKAALEVPRGDLNLAVCERCGFVFNATFDPTLLIYGQNYDNAQFFSRVFDDYLSGLVDHLVNNRGVQNCHVVEVGCGDGYFLRHLVEKGNNTGIGYDPSYTGPLEMMDGRIQFEQLYYGPGQADTRADVVICRHVIEHVPEPLALLNSVLHALSKSPSAYVFFETPTVEWILRHKTFWDFFYEHCSIFTPQSLTTAFQRAGFRVDQVRASFGGQYLWMEAGILSSDADLDMTYDAADISILAKEFAMLESSLKKNWQERIEALNRDGRVAIWGAGAKGVTFANLVDPDHEDIACMVDVNPRKQGCYLSGTGHPIVDYHALPSLGVNTVILMNPNYRDEVAKLLQAANLDIQLLDLTDGVERQ